MMVNPSLSTIMNTEANEMDRTQTNYDVGAAVLGYSAVTVSLLDLLNYGLQTLTLLGGAILVALRVYRAWKNRKAK